MEQPLRILVYCLLAGAGLTLLWYGIIWLKVPFPFDRVIMVIAAIMIFLWLLQTFSIL